MPKQNYQNNFQDERLDKLEAKIDDAQECLNDFRENHFFHLQSAVDKLQVNQQWLLKFFWLIATASVGSLTASVFDLIR